ncbi:hypothetical protein Tco_0625168 [Tanacetum coccineum]|uniref:CCHC-type domain-containing protein n=1 Tax=Tanacetum coccineum TaxID=301880 RepID=A0ABQ4WG24_9ASTR
MIELRADMELKDTMVVAVPKLNLLVGPKLGFKPTKQVYQHVSKRNVANTSGKKKQAGLNRHMLDDKGANFGMVSPNHGTPSETFGTPTTTPLPERINNLERQMLDEKFMLVDDDGKSLKVDPLVNSDSIVKWKRCSMKLLVTNISYKDKNKAKRTKPSTGMERAWEIEAEGLELEDKLFLSIFDPCLSWDQGLELKDMRAWVLVDECLDASCSLGMYYLSIFKVTEMVVKTVKSLRASFFWGGCEDTKKLAWVKWSNILASLDKGGVGVGSLKAFNIRPVKVGRTRAEFDGLILDISSLKTNEVVDSDSCIWSFFYDDNFSINKVRKHINERILPILSPSTQCHDSGTGSRRTERAARECTYTDFLKCQPLNFKGTEGVVGLTQWFEKMESVFHISNCTVACQIKFATCTLHGNALTWWNFHVKTWRDQEAGDRNVEPEGQGNGHCELHTTLQKMALMCGRMFPEESDQVEKYVGGLPDMIQGSVMASKPKTKQEAIESANDIIDQKVHAYVERQAENKRKFDHNNQAQQQPPKKQSVAIAYTAGSGERKEYIGTLPLCNRCKLHHNGLCTVKCENCKKVGHMTRDCRNPAGAKNQRTLTCFECRNQRHYRSDCTELKSQNYRNQTGGNEARGMVYALGGGQPDQDLDDMEDDINA